MEYVLAGVLCRGTKASLFPADPLEIEAGAAEKKEGPARAGGGRRWSGAGASWERETSRAISAGGAAEVALLGRNPGGGAVCLGWGGLGWRLGFQG